MIKKLTIVLFLMGVLVACSKDENTSCRPLAVNETCGGQTGDYWVCPSKGCTYSQSVCDANC